MKVDVPQDKAWKEQRAERWKELEYGYYIGTEEDEEAVKCFGSWFLEGDLAPLMAEPRTPEKQSYLDLRDVIGVCPLYDLEEYLQFFQDYANWLSENKLSYWGNRIAERDKDFITTFFHHFSGGFEYSTKEIHEHMLRHFSPNDDGVIAFPYKLGIDNWQPQLQVDLADYGFHVLFQICRYLFGDDEDFTYYAHVPLALPYVRYIKDLNPIYFSLRKINAKMLKASLGMDTQAGLASRDFKRAVHSQQMLRQFIGELHGYSHNKKEVLRHNDVEVEKQVRDLIDGLDMPKEYYRLLDFIKEFPDDYVTRSKKN